MIEQSRRRWGRRREEVEAKLKRWMKQDGEVAEGRKRHRLGAVQG